MPELKGIRNIQGVRGEVSRAVTEYAFTKDGGATGTYQVFKAVSPCVVYGVYAHTKEAFTGSGAVMSLGDTQSGTFAINASAVSNWAASGSVLPSPAPSGLYPRKLAAGDYITFGIGTAPLTAGRADIIVDFGLL